VRGRKRNRVEQRRFSRDGLFTELAWLPGRCTLGASWVRYAGGRPDLARSDGARRGILPDLQKAIRPFDDETNKPDSQAS
jgi:hypothetical protein